MDPLTIALLIVASVVWSFITRLAAQRRQAGAPPDGVEGDGNALGTERDSATAEPWQIDPAAGPWQQDVRTPGQPAAPAPPPWRTETPLRTPVPPWQPHAPVAVAEAIIPDEVAAFRARLAQQQLESRAKKKPRSAASAPRASTWQEAPAPAGAGRWRDALGGAAEKRRAVVLMTLLGPCRAVEEYDARRR